MARAILTTAAAAWCIGAAGAAATAIAGVDALSQALPALTIDAEALGGAVTTVAIGFTVAALVHVVVLAGIRQHRPRAWSAGILLAGLLAATFVALAAAAFTAAARDPGSAPVLIAGGAFASVAAAAYAIATVLLVGEVRARPPV